MARTLRRNHADGDVSGRLNEAEVNVEAVTEEQGVARLQVGLNVLGEDLRLGGIRSQQHDDVGPLGGLRVGEDLEAGLFGLHARLGAFTQTDSNLNARVAQVLRVGVALGAVADDGDLAALDDRQICICVVERFNCHECQSLLLVRAGAFFISSTL